jgi:GT2 family glycosyltransferase
VDVSIIYVNWNCADEILASIETVRTFTSNRQYEIIVVDNASAQGTALLAQNPAIHLIHNSVNSGFGAGCNLGVAQATGKYLLFLNPDTRFLNDVLTELMRFLDSHPKAGMAGPLMVDSANRVLFYGGRSLPTLFNEFLQHSTLSFRFPKFPLTAQPYLSTWDHLSTREVEAVVGACMLVRSDLFRAIKGFDEKFFLYSEELDLCCRLRQTGSQIWYVHTARILHKEQQSTMQLFGSMGRIVLQNLRSQHYYFQKHYGITTAFIWRHMIAALYLLRYLLRRDKLHLEYFRWAISA